MSLIRSSYVGRRTRMSVRSFNKCVVGAAVCCCILAFTGCGRLRNSPPGEGWLGGSGVASLGVGDPAPALNLDQWMTGEPATSGFEGKVHVVEFWATWCGPCRVSMPHLSELQQQFGDQVTMIGVTAEDAPTVEAFLASESPDGRPWNEVIQYRLVTDNQGATNEAYMRAANQNGIPTAFIVGRTGKIEWIGHPADIDAPLRHAIQGS